MEKTCRVRMVELVHKLEITEASNGHVIGHFVLNT